MGETPTFPHSLSSRTLYFLVWTILVVNKQFQDSFFVNPLDRKVSVPPPILEGPPKSTSPLSFHLLTDTCYFPLWVLKGNIISWKKIPWKYRSLLEICLFFPGENANASLGKPSRSVLRVRSGAFCSPSLLRRDVGREGVL